MVTNEKKEAAEKRRQNIITLKNTFSTEHGIEAMKILLDMTGFFEATTTGNPYQSAYNDGRRSVALSLIKAMKVDPNAVFDLFFDQDQVLRDEDFGYEEYPEDEI